LASGEREIDEGARQFGVAEAAALCACHALAQN
jgi:hypothetical protein